MLNKFLKGICSPLPMQDCIAALVVKCDGQGKCTNETFTGTIATYFDQDVLQRIGAKSIANHHRKTNPQRREKAKQWMLDECRVGQTDLDDYQEMGIEYVKKVLLKLPTFKKIYGGFYGLNTSIKDPVSSPNSAPGNTTDVQTETANASCSPQKRHQAESPLGVQKCCTKCNQTKSLDEFNNRARSGDRKASQCRVCSQKRSKLYTRRQRVERASEQLAILQLSYG